MKRVYFHIGLSPTDEHTDPSKKYLDVSKTPDSSFGKYNGGLLPDIILLTQRCCCCCHPICCLRRNVSLDTLLKTLQPGSQQ